MLHLRRRESSPVPPQTVAAMETAAAAAPTAPSENERIERYLDLVEAGLTMFAADLREGIRLELRAHLDALVTAHVELSDDRAVAVDAALRQFGPPEIIASRFLHAWNGTAEPERAMTTFRAVMPWFALSLVVSWTAAVLSCGYLGSSISGALSESPWFFFMVSPLPLAALGAVAGIHVGRRAPGRSSIGAFAAAACASAVSVPLYVAVGFLGSLLRHHGYSPEFFASLLYYHRYLLSVAPYQALWTVGGWAATMAASRAAACGVRRRALIS